jgi:ribosome maturation factor RimP
VAVLDTVRDLVAPIVDGAGCDLYDLEFAGGALRVVLDRDGGVDLETIALVTRLVSRELDHSDPIPGHYTLEVSSPGLERSLRRPDHYQRLIGLGWTVSVKTAPHVDGERRATGVLVAADDDGFTITLDEGPAAGETRNYRYVDVERARTVVRWTPPPKAGSPGATKPAKKMPAKKKAAATGGTTERKRTAS